MVLLGMTSKFASDVQKIDQLCSHSLTRDFSRTRLKQTAGILTFFVFASIYF